MIALIAHQTRYDLLSFRRDRLGRFFTVALPVIFLVIFVSVFGNNTIGPEHVKASTYYVPGIAALAIVSASFANLVISITMQRELGILKHRRATPVPAHVLIAGRALTAMVVSLAVMAIVVGIGHFAYGVEIETGTLPAVVLVAVIASLAFACMGYALTTLITSADSAQPVVLALTLPIYFISGVFIPHVRLPGGMQQVAEIFPVVHLVTALRDVLIPGAGTLSATDLAVVAAWGLAGLAFALARFSWTPRAIANT